MNTNTKSASQIRTRWQRIPKRPVPRVVPPVVRPAPRFPPKPPVVQAPPPPPPQPIQLLLNDPTTPNLVQTVDPITPSPPVVVKNYKGGGYPVGSYEWQAANCYAAVANTLNYYNSKAERAIPRWAGTSALYVLPRAGINLNAFYDRRNIQLLYATSSKIGGTVFTCDSADIVIHELGHGILDAYRPDMWSAALLEVSAFHECFGDFTAIMHSMQYDQMMNRALEETNMTLMQPSVISKLAEQFGGAIYKLVPASNGRNPNYLRCAVNDFKYVDPATLPADSPDNSLAAESHNFSRIFLGAIWDVYVMIYSDLLGSGASPLQAMKDARDLVSRYMLKAIQNAPLTAHFFDSMARTLLWTDVTLSNRKYHDRMQEIFANRNLLYPQLSLLSVTNKVEKTSTKIVKKCHKLRTRLGDHMLRAQSNNPLYYVHVDLPLDSAELYDNNDHIYDVIQSCKDECLCHAQAMIEFLHKTNSVSNSNKTPFKITKGGLVRTHFTC